MQPEQMILPTIATLALGTALLVPLRDDRLGKRATIGGTNAPLRPNFGALPGTPLETVAAPVEVPDDVDRVAWENETSARWEPARSAFRGALDTFGARVRDFFASPPDDDATVRHDRSSIPNEQVVERSFADTLGSLLPLDVPLEAPSAATAVPEPPLVVANEDVRKNASTPSFDRVVPLTRMPLRPQAREITWPREAPGGDGLVTEADRHAHLARAIRTADPALEPVLLAAYREEDAQGRLLALRALRSAACPNAEETFADALHVGTDDERSFAVDALFALGQRDAVTAAFNDRVEAIAAQAALGYVGTYRRADYVRELSPFVDRSRVETILALLAGIVE